MDRSIVVILFGGQSEEYEISLRSASYVLRRLSHALPLLPVGIAGDGRWLAYTGPVERLPDDTWRSDPACLAPVTPGFGVLSVGEQTIRPRAVLPVLHGGPGEDGRLQGLFETLGIPCLGCGAAASACAMHKHTAKALFAAAGLPTLPWLTVSSADLADPAALAARVGATLGYPVFVKPDAGGSSIGCAGAPDGPALLPALREALAHGGTALVEPQITADECEVAVFRHSGALRASRPGSVAYPTAFYDYKAKYASPDTRLTVPADLPPAAAERIRGLALAAFDALGCRHFARCDLFRRPSDGAVFLNEINTLPGMTDRSLFPALLADAGVPLDTFLTDLLDDVCPLGGGRT